MEDHRIAGLQVKPYNEAIITEEACKIINEGKDKSKNVVRPIFLVTAKGPTAPIKVQPNCTA